CVANRRRAPKPETTDRKAARLGGVTKGAMLASLTAMFVQRHPVAALLAVTALQIAGFLILFVAGAIDSDGLHMVAFAIAVIGALLAAAVMMFLAVTRSARSAALGAALFVCGAAFDLSVALWPSTRPWICLLIIAVAVPVIVLNRNL